MKHEMWNLKRFAQIMDDPGRALLSQLIVNIKNVLLSEVSNPSKTGKIRRKRR